LIIVEKVFIEKVSMLLLLLSKTFNLNIRALMFLTQRLCC